MASTQKLPSGRWRGRFRVGGMQYTKTFDYEFEAAQWAQDGERRARATAPSSAADTNQDDAPARNDAPVRMIVQPTVGEYGKRWLARHTGTRQTVTWYAGYVRVIAADPIGRMPIDTVRKSDVQEWMAREVAAGVPAPTRKGHLKTLRAIMRDAVAEEVAWRDATAGIKMPTIEKRAPVNPKRDTLTAVLDACDEHVRLIVLLALDAGLRWGEAAGMSAEAIVLDGDNPRMWVGQVVLRNREVRGYPKGHRARWVPITTERLADALRARVEAVGGQGLLSTAPDGQPVSYWVCRDRWANAREAAGVSLRFHDLRHVFGSDLGNDGMPRRDIMTVLGHADESTTAGYLHGNDNAAIFARARKAKAAGR